MQQLTESTFNRICRELIAVDADCLYGPFLFRRELAVEIANLDPELGWGWRPYLFARAFRQGQRIAAVVDDFFCPDDLRSEDERDKLHRVRQLNQNGAGILRGLNGRP